MRCRMRDGPRGSHHVDASVLKCAISSWSTEDVFTDACDAVEENGIEGHVAREH